MEQKIFIGVPIDLLKIQDSNGGEIVHKLSR